MMKVEYLLAIIVVATTTVATVLATGDPEMVCQTEEDAWAELASRPGQGPCLDCLSSAEEEESLEDPEEPLSCTAYASNRCKGWQTCRSSCNAELWQAHVDRASCWWEVSASLEIDWDCPLECSWTAPDPAPNTRNRLQCFSSRNSVEVLDQGKVSMKDLRAGDQIFTGSRYQPVYAFAHYSPSQRAEFFKIQTQENNQQARTHTFEVSGGHYVYTSLEGDGQKVVRADNLQIGQLLLSGDSVGTTVTVTGIEEVQSEGVFAPLTPDGKLQVSGVLISNYVSLDYGEEEQYALFTGRIVEFSHFGIAPFRLWCTRMTPTGTCDASSYQDGIPPTLAFMKRFFDWAIRQSFLIRSCAFTVYFGISAMAWTLELIPTSCLWVGFLACLLWSVFGIFFSVYFC